MDYSDFPAEPTPGIEADMVPCGDWYVDLILGRIKLPDPGPNGADM